MNTDNTVLLVRALREAGLALSASHGLWATDRSDLPREQWPMYRIDHRAELEAIDAALVAMSATVATAHPVIVEATL